MKNIREEIVYYMRRLYRQKLTTTSGGNISAKTNKYIYITPSGIDKARIQAKQIGKIKHTGELVQSDFPLSMETPMHTAIYQKREDVKAIVHAHSPYATAYTASSKKINAQLTSEGALVLGEIAWAPYALMGTQDLADIVAEQAEKSNLILMENHGVVALGKNLTEAFDRLEVLEFTAQMNFITQCLGEAKPLNAKQIIEIKNRI